MIRVCTAENTGTRVEIQCVIKIYLVRYCCNKLFIIHCAEQSGTSGTTSHGDSKDSIHSHSDHREAELGEYTR